MSAISSQSHSVNSKPSLSLGKLKQLARDDASPLVREGAKTAVEQIESRKLS